MPKINQEEYEVLKGLDDRWKWIARNYNGALIIYTSKPMKNPNLYWDSFGERIDDRLFQFIQWEDEEPYNIVELIEEYESDLFKNAKIVNLDASKIAGNASDYEHFYKRVGDSEETEVSFKDELKQEVEKIMTVTEYD